MTKIQKHYITGSEGLIARNWSASPLLFITSDSAISKTAQILGFCAPNRPILTFPAYDALPFEHISPSAATIATRLETLVNLINQDPKTKNAIVVTSVAALKCKVIPRAILEQHSFMVKVGDKLQREKLLETLVTFGFLRLSNACNAGEFAVRGSIIDIVLSDETTGYRIDLFGDKVESLRAFDPSTQRGLHSLNEMLLHPCDEVIWTDDLLKHFADELRTQFGLTAEHLIESFTERRKIPGQENLLPFIYREPDLLTAYLDPNTVVFCPYDMDAQEVAIDKELVRLHAQRASFKGKDGLPLAALRALYIDGKTLTKALSDFQLIELSPFAEQKEFLPLTNWHAMSKQKAISAIELFKQDIRDTTGIACFSEGSRQRLLRMLAEHDTPAAEVSSLEEVEALPAGIVGLLVMPMESGVSYGALRLFSEQDILGPRQGAGIKHKNFSKAVFAELSGFQIGELVVHVDHGLGRFEGLQPITVNKHTHDFVRIVYAEGDKFYLPVENLELISKFGSDDDMPLDKLGASSWQLRKAKLKKRLKLAAEELLKIAAQRALRTSTPLLPPADLYESFRSRFPYVETEGQQRAIEDTLTDLASGHPMDRLICGDVGFGKTEVALRAAFAALTSGEPCQVAILVPTTLLARQHSETFTKRFDGLPIRIAQLSKFSSRKEMVRTKEGLAQGSIDLVIGTHALLAKDISFKHLGLIIIDEEQHFGVKQKERLKEIKAHANVLTLSATPIPRTLQLSLNGIKDLSVIATPPLDRLPIKTFVMPLDFLSVREAILREYYRGGRVFYVTPRVAYLDSIISMLKEIVPEVEAQKAHGKMTATELDTIMNQFYDGKFNILVSTSIVESGLDISTANTVIIDRAHMFGLAQLYQIRGRVGRSNVQSFAYLTYPPGLKLSDTAEKRLQVLASFEHLGAGFSVASHDMDIRGYGNLVGEEQSGQVKEVGIELYQQMLEDTIKAISAENGVEDTATDIWSPTLNLKISAQIPESYVPDAGLRLSLYRRIAQVGSEEELQDLSAELVDRFGKLPYETENLISTVGLKLLAKEANIEKVDVGEKGIVLTFKDNKPSYPDQVFSLVTGNLGKVKLHNNDKLLIFGTFVEDYAIFKIVGKTLKHLASSGGLDI